MLMVQDGIQDFNTPKFMGKEVDSRRVGLGDLGQDEAGCCTSTGAFEMDRR